MSRKMELIEELYKIMKEEESRQEEPCEGTAGGVLLSTLCPGDVFSTDIGKFVVLEQGTRGTAVISQKFMREDIVFDDDSPDYKKSDLKELMDGEILTSVENVFGEENIIEHEVDLVTVDGQTDYGVCTCKVRPITFDEFRKYGKLLINTVLNDWWWTCTPWSTPERGYSRSVAVVSPSGFINFSYCVIDCGVRPFCILKSNIFVSKED